MKISDQDIIRTARQLRDEENEQLQVPELSINKSSNSKSSNSKLKYFLPAAAIIGFVLGYLTPRTDSSEGSPLTALVDTVYIKVHELKEDTLPRPEELVNPKTETPVKKAKGAVSPSRKHPAPATGIPVADDKIRYDLLVLN